ncbi:hypothetical protein ACVWXN_000399 [Bradyrhizobium sp. i1.4.4]
MGGVVDENVDTAEVADRQIDDLPAMVRGSQITFHQDRLTTFGFDESRYFLGVVVLIEIGNQDIGALAGESDGDSPSYSAITAGDDGPSCRRPDPL